MWIKIVVRDNDDEVVSYCCITIISVITEHHSVISVGLMVLCQQGSINNSDNINLYIR